MKHYDMKFLTNLSFLCANKVALIFLLFCTLVSSAQTDSNSIKNVIIGYWTIKTILINGELSNEFNPDANDMFVFNNDNTFICSDNEYGYDQSGNWKLFDGDRISLFDSLTGENTEFQIQIINASRLDLTSNYNTKKIRIELVRKE